MANVGLRVIRMKFGFGDGWDSLQQLLLNIANRRAMRQCRISIGVLTVGLEFGREPE